VNDLQSPPERAEEDDEEDADEDRDNVRAVGTPLGAHVVEAMLELS
jgi:hypothetical protein